jgi:hypothetical protein
MGPHDFEDVMKKFLNRIWYRWMLRKYGMDRGYTAPLWNHAKDSWIYPDGTFVAGRADYV